MKRSGSNCSGGFSLIEVVVAIAILGLITVPLGGGLVLAHRLNARSQSMLEARLAVSAAVETLMAEGIQAGAEYSSFPDVSVEVTPETEQTDAYTVKVISLTDETVSVTTRIRPAGSAPEGGEEGGGGGL